MDMLARDVAHATLTLKTLGKELYDIIKKEKGEAAFGAGTLMNIHGQR
jgi:hypothetical protein